MGCYQELECPVNIVYIRIVHPSGTVLHRYHSAFIGLATSKRMRPNCPQNRSVKPPIGKSASSEASYRRLISLVLVNSSAENSRELIPAGSYSGQV